MSKLRDYIDIVKTKDLTAEKLKKLYDNNGYIALLTGGKSFGYTKEILPEYLQQGEILAIPVGGSFNVKYHNGFYYNANNYILQTKENLDIKYLYYQLQNKKTSIEGLYQGWGCKKLKIQSLLNLEIKLPCILKQREIVKVLDLLTSLTKELTTKIFDKDKQYKYYLSELFNMKSEFLQKLLEGKKVEWRTLGEVFDIFAGGDLPTNFSKEKEDNFNIPILSNGIDEKSFYGWTDVVKVSKPSLTISARGTIGWTSIQYEPFYPIVRLLVLTPKLQVNINLKYSYYYMKMIENNYNVAKSGIPQLTKPMINKIIIPIPPLSKQQEIVEVLDKFDALTNSITEGLPREIELRQKQYEYYRNKLWH